MMKLYGHLSGWWPLLSPPSEYIEESSIYHAVLRDNGDQPCRTLLELGSGGGSNAFHLKQHFDLTLVDPSEGMLAVSQSINPDCEHFIGDMRSIRLQRTFDRVFIHDAICYMTTLDDLQLAVETAFLHCRPGGAALFAPDFTRETFQSGTDHGGHDGPDRSLRYLEWTWDPDPNDNTYFADYAFMLRDQTGRIQVEHDRHIEGLFCRSEWLAILERAGFKPQILPFTHSGEEREMECFIGVKPTRRGAVPPAPVIQSKHSP